MLSALPLQPKGFSKHCPHLVSVSHKEDSPLVFLVVLHNESLPPTQPYCLPPVSQQPPATGLNLSPPWHTGPLSSPWGIGGVLQIDPLAPRNLTGEHHTFSKPCHKADPGLWGRSGALCSLAEAEGGLHQAPHLTIAGHQQRPLLSNPEVEQMFGMAVPDVQRASVELKLGVQLGK